MSINKLNFNSSNLSNEINKIVNKGLNEFLNEFIVNYKLYEETHKAVMNLPSVKHEINKLKQQKNKKIIDESESESENDSESESEYGYVSESESETQTILSDLSETNVSNKLDKKNSQQTFKSIKDMAHDLIKEEMKELESKILSVIDNMMKNNPSSYANLYNMLNKMEENYCILSKKMEKIENDLTSKEVYDLTNDSNNDNVTLNIDDIEVKIEKENIKLEINEIQNEMEDLSDLTTNENVEGVDDDNVENENDEEDQDQVEDAKEAEFEAELETQVVSEDEDVEAEDEDVEAEDEDVEAEDEVESEDEVEDQVEVEAEDEAEDEGEADDEDNDNDSVDTEKDKEEADDEEEYTEIEIDDVTFCTNNEENGFIYELNNGEVGNKVGYLKDGEPFFYADE